MRAEYLVATHDGSEQHHDASIGFLRESDAAHLDARILAQSFSYFFGPVGIVFVSFLIISSAGFPPLQAGWPKPLALTPF
jgi:hypothetical protein